MYGRIGYPVDAPTSMHHGMHAHLENELDAILLWKYKKKKPSEFNQTATICLNGQEIQFISHFLASCINETYYPITYRNNFQVTPAMVHRSIWALRFGCRTLSDKNGKKKFYNVDVGIVEAYAKNDEGKTTRKQFEVDFVVNQGSQRYYIQVAYDMTSR